MTDAQRRAQKNYRATHTKRIGYDIPVEKFNAWQAAANAAGKSMRSCILDAMDNWVSTVPAMPPDQDTQPEDSDSDTA